MIPTWRNHRRFALISIACLLLAFSAGCKDSNKPAAQNSANKSTGQQDGLPPDLMSELSNHKGKPIQQPPPPPPPQQAPKPDPKAAEMSLIKAIDSANTEQIQQAIDAGTDINAPLPSGTSTPLTRSAGRNNVRAIEVLLSKGAKLDARDRQGLTAMDAAIIGRHVETVRLLIEKGMDLLARDKSGSTYLHRAAQTGSYEIVDLLLRGGADPQAADSRGQLPLHKACIAGNLPCVERLMDRQTDVNVRTQDGWTVLHCTDNLAVATYLLDKGVNVNAKCAGDVTVLHQSCLKGNTEMIRKLLDCGADVNARTTAGLTPLAMAINRKSDAMIVAILLDHGADLNVKYDKQKSALHLAAALDEVSIVRLLLEKGAEVNAKDQDGKTPLASTVNVDVQDLLVKAGGRE